MGNFITCTSNNRFIFYCTLGTFAFTAIKPLNFLNATSVEKSVNFSDISFGIRMEKLIEKTKKYFEAKNGKKLTEIMFDIKHELEGYTGQKIDLNKHLDQIEKEAKSKGMPIDKVHMKEMRKRFKKQEKRWNHKALYMTDCLEYNIPFSSEEENQLYETSGETLQNFAKSSKEKDEEIELPLRVTIGVTMSLVGLFLYVIPFPVCKAAAPWVLEAGLAFLVDQSITDYEEKKRKDKE